jgi:hypothetical protein
LIIIIRLDDDYGRFLLLLASGHLDFILPGKTVNGLHQTFARKTRDYVYRRKNGRSGSALLRKTFQTIICWGSTAPVPLYNVLGLLSQIVSERRLQNFTRFLSTERTCQGTTSLSHCFSTQPTFALEYALILYDAGGESDINNRNRYSVIVTHEIMLVYDPSYHWQIVVEKGLRYEIPEVVLDPRRRR